MIKDKVSVGFYQIMIILIVLIICVLLKTLNEELFEICRLKFSNLISDPFML